MKLMVVKLLAWLTLASVIRASESATNHSFTMHGSQFLKDGQPFQIIAGSIDYFRIPSAYWADRLQRVRSMGLNTITVYVAWNVHEPLPGQFLWEGEANLEGWLRLAADEGLLVVLRPGPYICAEWDFGGLPWWLASHKVSGGRTMRLRSSDPQYLQYVDRFWGSLFERMRPLTYAHGGPIIMAQVENEYGFCGDDKEYLRHLISLAKDGLGEDVILFTTDPPSVADRGSLAGEEILTVVDFGPQNFNLDYNFGVAKRLNGVDSPLFDSEFYTGWLSHWGERMANSSATQLGADTRRLLSYGDGNTSISFYMVHGGTNFGFAQGANVEGHQYQPHITSYDYDSPISEAGDYCQPGIDGPCKFQELRKIIEQHTGASLPPVPPRPKIQGYGRVNLNSSIGLLDALDELSPMPFRGRALPMEDYGQRWGLILYRHLLNSSNLKGSPVVDLGLVPHDYCTVWLDGHKIASLDRSSGQSLVHLPSSVENDGSTTRAQKHTLDILVEAMGRKNFGCDGGGWDLKGLQSSSIKLGKTALEDWTAFPLPLDNIAAVPFPPEPTISSVRKLLGVGYDGKETAFNSSNNIAPVFFKGYLELNDSAVAQRNNDTGLLPDTYLSLDGWSKGVAWVNGFNLGWYWPRRGPQMTLYVPGSVLFSGANTVVILELEKVPQKAPSIEFVAKPDFYGPQSADRLHRPSPYDYKEEAYYHASSLA